MYNFVLSYHTQDYIFEVEPMKNDDAVKSRCPLCYLQVKTVIWNAGKRTPLKKIKQIKLIEMKWRGRGEKERRNKKNENHPNKQ